MIFALARIWGSRAQDLLVLVAQHLHRASSSQVLLDVGAEQVDILGGSARALLEAR
jgi:hypothetical protein